MRTIWAALMAAGLAAPAMAGDVGVVKGPGWWVPIYVHDPVRGPIAVAGPVYTVGGVTVTPSVGAPNVSVGVPRGGVGSPAPQAGGVAAPEAVAAGGPAPARGPAAAGADAQDAGSAGSGGARVLGAIPVGADRAALLRMRQSLAEEAARRGLR